MNQIEKVARAMCRADPEVRMGDADGVVEQRVNTEWVHYVDQAKAAIAAMPVQAEPVAELRAEITRLTEALRAAEEREKALREAVDRLRSGYDDAISGYRYILTQHGRLEGVGFTRVMDHYHEWVVMPQREGLMAGSHTLAGAKP